VSQNISNNILILIVGAMILSSCSHDYDPFYYKTTNVQFSNANNAGPSPVDAGLSVPVDAYAIKMYFSMELTVKGDDKYESSFINEDEVSIFEITSLDTFNMLPPNSILNSYFYYGTGATGYEITDYSGIANGANRDLETWDRTSYMFLMDPPVTGNYSFVVDLIFSDGREFKDTLNVNLY